MRIQGEPGPVGANGGYDTKYRCLTCDSTWLCHTDKWGFNSGFKLLPTPIIHTRVQGGHG
jgi:hypothetical protein